MFESVLRKLARDQWVRMHGTPRVTVLVGGDQGGAIWAQWAAVSGLNGALLEGDFDAQVRQAVDRAVASPTQPIAILASVEEAAAWRAGRRDRLAAMVDEGWIEVSEVLPGADSARMARAGDAGAGDAGAVAPRGTQGRQLDAVAGGAQGRQGDEVAAGAQGRQRDEVAGGAQGRQGDEVAAGAQGRPGDEVAGGAQGRQLDAVAGGAQERPGDEVACGTRGRESDELAGGAQGRQRDEVASDGRVGPRGEQRPVHVDARSVAEAMLFEALEATPATAGRFALNEALAVRFGSVAAEVDLLSRGDGIAIEIDGVHHFADLDGYRRDRKKDVLLQGQGLFVVRVLAEDVMRDVRGAVTVVVQALAYRRAYRRAERG